MENSKNSRPFRLQFAVSVTDSDWNSFDILLVPFSELNYGQHNNEDVDMIREL